MLAAVVGSALLVDGENARRFEPLKVVFVRACAIAAVCALLAAWLADERPLRARFHALATRLRREPIALAALFLAAVWIASTAFALSPRTSLWGSFARLQGTLSLLSYAALGTCVALAFRTRERIARLADALVLTSVPVALVGVAQRYGLDPFALMPDPRRVASTLGAPNFAASFAALALPVTLARLVAAVVPNAARERGAHAPAVYGFAGAAQLLLLVFTQSRGPLLGALAGAFAAGTCLALDASLRARGGAAHAKRDLARAAGELARAAALALAGAGIGGLAAALLERVLASSQGPLTHLVALGAGAGGALGLAFAFVRLALDARRKSLTWLAWLGAAGLAIAGLALLNLRGTPLDFALDPLRRAPLVGRFAKLGSTESGTVGARLAIWKAALELGDRPIGVPGSDFAPLDPHHAWRTWLGYGPDSLYLAFPAVAPPELARFEERGSSADRAHDETIDALVTTGRLGALASYLLWAAAVARALELFGLSPDRASRRRLLAASCAFGLAAVLVARALGPGWTLVPLALPMGLLAGVLAHAAREGFAGRAEPPERPPLLAIGFFGLVVAWLVQMHVLFPTSPSYVLFACALGALVASRSDEEPERDAPLVAARLDAWPLACATALLAFAFVRTPVSERGSERPVVFALVVGLSFFASTALAPRREGARVPWRHALAASSGLGALFLPLLSGRASADGARRVESLAFELALFAGLVALLALAHASPLRALRRLDRKALVRATPLAAGLLLAGFALRNQLDLARAGVWLEAGDRLAQGGDPGAALPLHERAREFDPREPRLALALARDLQALASDPRTSDGTRALAFERGEAALVDARALEPYDVDASANLGRFESTRAAAGERERFAAALARFDEACALAPRDPDLELYAARTLLAAGDARGAADRAERALALDRGYAASWSWLGDARLALGESSRALEAHRAALAIAERGNDGPGAFGGEGFEERLDAYARAGMLDELARAVAELAAARPADFRLAAIAARARERSRAGSSGPRPVEER